MIKCPHCGSTAQVIMNSSATLSDNLQYLTLGCECGCGQHFRVSYNIDDYEECEALWQE